MKIIALFLACLFLLCNTGVSRGERLPGMYYVGDTFDLPQVPGSIVYMVNSEVTRVVPFEEAPESTRFFYVYVEDEQGNKTLQYVRTAVVKTAFIDEYGKEVPHEKALSVYKHYYDTHGNIIHQPYVVLTKDLEKR